PTPAASPPPATASPAPARPAGTPAVKPAAVKPAVVKPAVVARGQTGVRPSDTRLRTIGVDLLVSFWRSVAADDPTLSETLFPNSPATTAHRLFGARGLVSSVGLPVDSTPEKVWGGTRDPSHGDRIVTEGKLETSRAVYPVALVWRWVNGRVAIDEILPYAAFDPRLHPRAWYHTPGRGALARPPLPRVGLDVVAQHLWDAVPPVEGLPLLTRCLTAWWRLEQTPAATGHPPRVLAAALLRSVSWRSGDRVSTADCATRFQVMVPQIKSAESYLQARLQLSAEVRW
ncbi:MAG TPA: hypothetical protein VHN80_32980, partial [Kineosporiaceae bacterium]|nr:hypothetical protein [Kineosporiaceae bacterium]